MAEQLTVYKTGDRFATMTMQGEILLWEISASGVPLLMDAWWRPIKDTAR